MAVQGQAAFFVNSLMHVAAPDYRPPDILYKDADEIYLPAGRYYKMGGDRHRGQYREPSQGYWTVASDLAVDLDGTYSAGVTSGMLGAAKVNSSWYSLFLMSNSVVLVLPYLRIKAIAYSDPSTTINPGDHLTGGSNDNGFLLANDAWNNYRLVKKSIGNTYNGYIYTIADSVNGTPDQVLIAGDKTGELAALDWLQMIPPAGTPCLYLGTVGLDSGGNLIQFNKSGWRTQFYGLIAVTGNRATSADNTEIAAAIPPSARIVYFGTYVSSEASSADFVRATIYSGTSGSTGQGYASVGQQAAGAYLKNESNHTFLLTVTSFIRNQMTRYPGPAAADVGEFCFSGWEE